MCKLDNPWPFCGKVKAWSFADFLGEEGAPKRECQGLWLLGHKI
jgi:hypothetical protein